MREAKNGNYSSNGLRIALKVSPQNVNADYIHTAFVNKLKSSALHVSCSWHKNRAERKWVAALGAAARSILTMVRTDTVEELILRENRALVMISEFNRFPAGQATC